MVLVVVWLFHLILLYRGRLLDVKKKANVKMLRCTWRVSILSRNSFGGAM